MKSSSNSLFTTSFDLQSTLAILRSSEKSNSMFMTFLDLGLTLGSKEVVNDEFEEDFIYDHLVYSITEGRRVFSNDKYFGFPCFAHEEPKYKLKDCEAGKCQDFLSMTRVDRLRVVNERTLCTLCLLRACRIRQGADSLCLFSKVVPKNIACKSCKSKNVDRNILLCHSG